MRTAKDGVARPAATAHAALTFGFARLSEERLDAADNYECSLDSAEDDFARFVAAQRDATRRPLSFAVGAGQSWLFERGAWPADGGEERSPRAPPSRVFSFDSERRGALSPPAAKGGGARRGARPRLEVRAAYKFLINPSKQCPKKNTETRTRALAESQTAPRAKSSQTSLEKGFKAVSDKPIAAKPFAKSAPFASQSKFSAKTLTAFGGASPPVAEFRRRAFAAIKKVVSGKTCHLTQNQMTDVMRELGLLPATLTQGDLTFVFSLWAQLPPNSAASVSAVSLVDLLERVSRRGAECAGGGDGYTFRKRRAAFEGATRAFDSAKLVQSLVQSVGRGAKASLHARGESARVERAPKRLRPLCHGAAPL